MAREGDVVLITGKNDIQNFLLVCVVFPPLLEECDDAGVFCDCVTILYKS